MIGMDPNQLQSGGGSNTNIVQTSSQSQQQQPSSQSSITQQTSQLSSGINQSMISNVNPMSTGQTTGQPPS